MKDLMYEGSSFNCVWVSSFATEALFLANAKINNYFAGDENQDNKLKDIYSIVVGSKAQEKADREAKIDAIKNKSKK
mgnify:FL=1